MWPFVALTGGLVSSLVLTSAYMRRDEVTANWSKYRSDPLFMFAAPLFKPADDPRSRLEFATENFRENISNMVHKIFIAFLEPVFKIFRLFTDAITQSLGGLFNIRMLLGKMWNSFNKMTDIFMRRFNTIIQRLRVTFIQLFSSFEKTFGVAISSLYAGLSTIHTITSFIDLIMKIIIVILVILVVMMIFLFFVLLPVMPLIFSVVMVIAGTAMGGAVGGMASTFCFAKDTQIQTVNGPRPISEIVIGTRLEGGGAVQGIMKFATDAEDIYDIYGVHVSASHIVYFEGEPIHVSDHPDASKLQTVGEQQLYCLITSDHKIPIISNMGPLLFADWEELTETENLMSWHKYVFTALNPGCEAEYKAPNNCVINSEAVFSERTRIWTTVGPVEIRGISPGYTVIDAAGEPTRVTGVVAVARSEVSASTPLSAQANASAGAWILDSKDRWNQLNPASYQVPPESEKTWYSLFTESGTFRLCEDTHIGIPVRDFSDVGSSQIAETYDWVLGILKTEI